MTQAKIDKLNEIDNLVSEFQQRLATVEVLASERSALAVLGDLLVNLDIARRDIYWLIKEIKEDNIYYMEQRG